jgi:flagellar basal body-associated protein FliL
VGTEPKPTHLATCRGLRQSLIGSAFGLQTSTGPLPFGLTGTEPKSSILKDRLPLRRIAWGMRRALSALLLLALATGSALAAEDGGDTDKKKAKAPEHKLTQSESWVELDDFYTTIVGDNRPAGMLMVRLGLDIPEPGLRENAEHAMPVLRDAYLRSLMAYTATSVRLDSQPDITLIADRLQTITDRALKKKGARILLRQVALRAK